MPTATEFKELYDNTDRVWTTINGVNGWKFMKKSDHSVYVFFPAAGNSSSTNLSNVGFTGSYWSSSLDSTDFGYSLYFGEGAVFPQRTFSRNRGLTVRAVKEAS
jgi:uncharacterized protein (TIGR02145 family)